MASSRKSSSSARSAADFAAGIAARLGGRILSGARLAVGLSGGVDSVALLDCLRRAARRNGWRIAAVHVNHQLSPNAGRWVAFCRRLCARRGIPLEVVKVDVACPGSGQEAAARAARYGAFAKQDCDYIVLAHHLDDQAETVLLQLLRGAGVKGLAAMPLVRKTKGGKRKAEGPAILRPLLDVTRAEILSYARARGLKWIEDESNRDTRHARNFLRHEVLPLVEQRFPAYRATLARSARHLGEAAAVLDEVAAADGAGRISKGSLAVSALRRLPPARARNLLRYFINNQGVSMPGAERLDEALRQIVGARQDAQVVIELDGARLRRFDGRVHLVRAAAVPREMRKRWRGERRLALPELGGTLALERTRGRGIGIGRLGGAAVTVRLRRGGERLQPDRRRPRRSLKNLLQEARVAPWQRECLPLLFHGEQLVWVPGVGIDCSFRARRGEPALAPSWLPGPGKP